MQPSENMRSKRHPIPQQDDVDAAIERMQHQVKFNPLRRFWWRYLVLAVVIFMLWSFFAPAWARGGPGGISQILVQLAIQLLVSAMFAVFFIYIQFFAIARPRIYWLKPTETGISFKDYKGNPQVLEMAREVVLLLKGSKDFKYMGGEYIRGLMLEGDPGVGKSYLAQAMASEAGLPFGYCSAPSLQSPFIAGGMLAVRNMYKKARKLSQEYGGCILFLDEIDAVAQSRAGSNNQGGGMGMGMGGMMGAGNTLINELLMQLDPPPVDNRTFTKFLRWIGLDFRRKKAEIPPVLTIAATNLVETLDKALLRPGRFDRKITVGLPDGEGRQEVIDYYLNKVNHENIPLDRFVNETVGYTPVAIKYVINEAVIRAHFEGRDALTYKDLIAARDMHEVGLRQPIRRMSREERRRIAYHETGHAIAQALLVPWERIVKVTIIRHGHALGFMQPKEIEERYTRLKEEIEVDIQVSLASRAAEEIFLHTQMTGFSGDLSNATSQAIVYCGMVGMNGHLSSMNVLQMPASGMQIEIENFLQIQYKKVKQLLEANQEMCHALAEALLEKEELLGDDITEIIGRFKPNLTADAKAKRMGFHIVRGAENEAASTTGVATEGVATPAAATGTYGGSYGDEDGVVFPGAAAFQPSPTAPKAPATTLNPAFTPTVSPGYVSSNYPAMTTEASRPLVVEISAAEMKDKQPKVSPPAQPQAKIGSDDDILPSVWWE